MPIGEAARSAMIVIMAFPDHEQGRCYRRVIASALPREATLVFLHGLAIHFGLITPPKQCDIVLLAPHAPGSAVRSEYLGKRSLSAFAAVYQDYSGKARRTVRELAIAIGIKPSRLVNTTFQREAIGDLFGEQAVLCGGLSQLILAGFETLVKQGMPAEHAYLEVAYQLDLIIALIKQHGIRGMFDRISVAARLGSLETGPRVINRSVRAVMRRQLARIESGAFAQKLSRLTPAQLKQLSASLDRLSSPAFERAAKRFRPKTRR